MNVMVVLCHPLEKSFNHALAEQALSILTGLAGEVVYHDLYEERFDPVLTAAEIRRRFSFDAAVQQHMKEVETAEGFVIIHPDWWGQMPALLKGWVDRVLAPGVAYEFSGEEFMEKEKVPLLTGKKAAVFVTTDAAGDDRCAVLRSIWQECIFGYCGIEDTTCTVMQNVRASSYNQRQAWFGDVGTILKGWFAS